MTNNEINSASKKTKEFSVFVKKAPNTRLSKFLKSRSPDSRDDCFKNENNAVVGVFLQRINKSLLNRIVFILLFSMLAISSFAQTQRFPKPEFETGYTQPTPDTP
ncbi:MAG: hypothetical protein K9G70_05595, partial [Prolixibacteraceae bacterium]|nr:hypothetical protein [Prolixibacteraceae bacterium]